MPGVPDLASARGPVGTRTNQGSRIDYNYRETLSPLPAWDAQSTNFGLLWAIS